MPVDPADPALDARVQEVLSRFNRLTPAQLSAFYQKQVGDAENLLSARGALHQLRGRTEADPAGSGVAWQLTQQAEVVLRVKEMWLANATRGSGTDRYADLLARIRDRDGLLLRAQEAEGLDLNHVPSAGNTMAERGAAAVAPLYREILAQNPVAN